MMNTTRETNDRKRVRNTDGTDKRYTNTKQKWIMNMTSNNTNEHNRHPHERRLMAVIVPPLRRGLRRLRVASPDRSLLHNPPVKRGKRMHAHEYNIFTHNMADLRPRRSLDGGQPLCFLLRPPPPPLCRSARIRSLRHHLRQHPDNQNVDS